MPKHDPVVSESPTEIDVNGKTLSVTIETTGDQGLVEHGDLAKGSHGPAGAEALASAPTIASESGGELGGHGSRLHEGGKLGRLEIGKTLGDGAFGVVVAAYDPQLKRKLAVKILKAEVFSSPGGQEAQARLLREARAMARIEHANVVAVHDIGTVDGQVYVAMQFVEGNLRKWLGEESRSWKEIVEKFVQAGRGLEAAHALGLVHRDFKPDNVLVGNAGEVRVADFGLVSISDLGSERIVSSEFDTAPQSSDNLEITRAGALMGTALYMAPEQHRGEDATAASDQFAFCVALYWALYRRQPFEGKDYASLRQQVLAGKIMPPPTTAMVPRWLGKLVRKGLALRAEDRHESMAVLVSLLSEDRSLQPRRWLSIGLPILGGAALTTYLLMHNGSSNPCDHQGQKLSGVWDQAAKDSLRTSFASVKRPEGFASLQAAVDGYTQDWVSVRTRVCEATHLFGEQSDSLLDQRMLCLDQRLNYLREFLAQLVVEPGAELMDTALKVVLDLPGLDSCTGVRVAGGNVALPESPEQKQAVIQLEASVDKAQALFDLGQFEKAKEVLEADLDLTLPYAPSLARALSLLGKAKIDVGQLEPGESDLRASIEYATASGDDLLVARSWLALMQMSGVLREDYEQGHQMGELARLAMIRGQAGPLEMANVDKATATILLREGKNDQAIARLQAALPVYEKSASKHELALLLAALGDGMVGDLNYEEAVNYYRLALAHIEATLGARHPENIYVLNNLSVALKGMGDIAGARAALDASLLAIETSYGPESRDLVTVLNNLGNIVRREGDLVEAKAVFARAIRIGDKSLEPGHPLVTKAMMNLAIVYASNQEHALATATFREVLIRTKASFTSDHPDTAMALNNLGEALVLEGKFTEALGYVQEAVDMKGRLYGVDHPRQTSSIATLASVYVGLGDNKQGANLYARALAIYQEAVGDEHALTIATYSELGRLHQSTRADAKAIPLLLKAVQGRGPGDESLAQAEDSFALARAYWSLGKRAESQSLLETLGQRPGSPDTDLAERVRLWRAAHH